MERPVFIEECGEEMGLISLISNLYSGLCFTTLISVNATELSKGD